MRHAPVYEVDLPHSLADGVAHGVPNGEKEGGKILVLMLKYVIRKTNITRLADIGNLCKVLFPVTFGVSRASLAHYTDLTAADRQHAHPRDFLLSDISNKIHGVGMLKHHAVIGIKHNLA